MKFQKLIRKSQQILPLINPENRCLHCSFLLNKNKIVSFGWNDSFKSHPLGKLTRTRFNSTHAENHAIIKCRWRVDRLDQLTMVNLRFRRDGTLGNSKPCTSCQELLGLFGIKKIYYSTEEGEFAQMKG